MDRTEFVERFACRAEQTAVLQGHWAEFRSRCGPAAIPYRLHFGTALVAGEPLSDPASHGAALMTFLRFCSDRRWHAVFVPCGLDFARVAAAQGCSALKIGEEPTFDLANWGMAGRSGAKLRAALNHAHRMDVCVGELVPDRDDAARRQMIEVRDAWRGRRGSAQLGFVLGGDPVEPRPGRRWFAAQRRGEVQAFVTSSPLSGHRAVGIDAFVRSPGAVRGSVEAAIVAALRTHRTEGSYAAVVPMAPLRGLTEDTSGSPLLLGRDDIEHRAALGSLRLMRRHGGALYRAQTLEQFKVKLNPTAWQPVYLVHYPARLRPRCGVAAALELLPGTAYQRFGWVAGAAAGLVRGCAGSEAR